MIDGPLLDRELSLKVGVGHQAERQKEVGHSSGTSNAMRYTSTHPHRQDIDAESCGVKRRREETLAVSKVRLSLTKKERRKQKRSNPKGVFFTEDEIILTKITLQIKDPTHGTIKNWQWTKEWDKLQQLPA